MGFWLDKWMVARGQLNLVFGKDMPPMPVPDSAGRPTVRSLTTTEFGTWANMLLQQAGLGGEKSVSSHSCKATLLSYASKFGLPHQDRLVLGYHTGGLSTMLGYSRDSSVRPLQLLDEMLLAIRTQKFFPDANRSNRFPDSTPVPVIV
ncbi:MAG: hypothetical protein AAGJ35_09295, partial [Myxococcota bacterium]